MTFDGRSHRLGPGDQLPLGAVTSFRGQRARNVRHGISTSLKFSETHDPITRSNREPD